MSTVIVPVGLAMGRDYAAGDPGDDSAASWEVHLGDTPAYLTREEMLVWAAAFLEPERHANRAVNRASLAAKLAAGSEITADPETVMSRLVERGLLVEYDPVDGRLEELFRELQLVPLAQGNGNSPEQPGRYEIGFAGQTLIDVDPNVYAIWSYSFHERSLWDACAALATGLDEDLEPGEEPLGLTADEVARDVAMSLPLLVVTGCAFIDPVAELPV